MGGDWEGDRKDRYRCAPLFLTQHTRYSKLTADMHKSGPDTDRGKKFQMTERAKWILRESPFLDGHIMRKALTQIVGLSSSTATAVTATVVSSLRPDESDADVESAMNTSGHGLSQQLSFSAATTYTPAQSQDPAFLDMYRQTQVLLSDFLKEKNQQNSKCQPFYKLEV